MTKNVTIENKHKTKNKTKNSKSIFNIPAVVLAIATLLALATCGQTQESYEPHDAVYPDYDGGYITSETDEETPNHAGQAQEQEQEQGLQATPASLNLTRECFLYDFDYLMTMLQENAPYFGLIYRRNGVDMLALIPELRARIEDESFHPTILSFFNLLRNNFFYHAWPVTHLWFEPYGSLREFSLFDRFDNTDGMLRFRHSLHGPPQAIRIPSTEIETSVIEEGYIAYISVRTFNNTATPELRRQIDDFYITIENFEHLIIDLRGNPGGWTPFFDELIISPLLTEPLRSSHYHFVQGGEHNVEHMINNGFLFRRPFSATALDRLFPSIYITQEVMGDLSMMDYYLIKTWTVLPSSLARQIQFDGRVWILTDGHMTSASHMAVAFYKHVGFATLVGETTGGMYVHQNLGSNYVQLPRTGLVVRMDITYVLDGNARPVNYGIDPHYFNLPGMDALETVLELIRRGE